jgi:hypothetical protein
MGHQGLTLGIKNLVDSGTKNKGFPSDCTMWVLHTSCTASIICQLLCEETQEKKKENPMGAYTPRKKERKKEAYKMRTKKPKNL